MKFQTTVVLLLAVRVRSFQILPPQSHATTRWGGSSFLLATVDSKGRETIVNRLKDSAVEIHIPVPGSATKAAYDKVCMELSKQISVPGFRKGSKIPPQVLEQAMSAKGGRNALRVQAINELTNQLVEPALKEQALDPIGQPVLVVPAEELAESFQPGEALTLEVKCDVWPEIQWKTVEGKDKPYVGLTGKYSRKPFDQAKLDRALNDLKERYATLEPISDPSHVLQMGDACVVNMEGFLATDAGEKGDPLPNAASGDRVEVVLGQGRYMEGLVEGLVGAKVGDTVQVKVSFPDVREDNTNSPGLPFCAEILSSFNTSLSLLCFAETS
jgi:trigger factor